MGNGNVLFLFRLLDAFGLPTSLDCLPLRTPVAFAQEGSYSLAQTGAKTIHGSGLSGIIAACTSNKSKKVRVILGQQIHKNFGETVTQLDSVARFMEGSACPKMLNLVFIPELMVFLSEFGPQHRWLPSADHSPIRRSRTLVRRRRITPNHFLQDYGHTFVQPKRHGKVVKTMVYQFMDNGFASP